MKEKIKNFLFEMLAAGFVVVFLGFIIIASMPEAVNIYKIAGSNQIIKIVTKDGVITDQAKIKEVLAGHNDQHTFYIYPR